MMYEPGVLAFALHRIHGVPALSVGMIHPCEQDFEAPQIAALLMWNEIVGIVRANSLVAERPCNFREGKD